jgi:soluble lytic murein transglycosylase
MRRYLLLLLPLFVFAQDITLDWLSDKPRSLYKDFYIWRFLDQDISANEANEAMYQSSRINHKILKKWAAKSDDIYAKEYYRCTTIKPENYKNESAECVAISISPMKAKNLTNKQRIDTAKKLRPEYPILADMVEVMGSKTPFSALITKDKDVFFEVFNKSNYEFRDKNLNRTIPARLLEKVKDERDFQRTIALIVTESMLDKLHKSLFDLDGTNYSHVTNFFLAMNAMKYNVKDRAKYFLDLADKKAYFQFDKDKVLFWRYMLTGDEIYLMKLSQSWDINIYSYYAMEKLGVEPSNLVTNLKSKKKKNSFDISNPFAWLPYTEKKRISDEEMLEYFKEFSTEDTLPHLAMLLEKKDNYKKAYFITPYSQYLKDVPTDRKAMIYAIGRQESRFVPSSISTSYAMGIMQFMPFVSKMIAGKKNEPYYIDNMFTPKKSYEYADYYVSYLTDHLEHPLLVAYAYNGGIGRITRMLKRDVFFKSNHKLDPYLSLELIPYSEPRRYGKKVLLNYVIYKKILNQPVTLDAMLKSVKNNY